MKDRPIDEFLREKHDMQDCCYDNLTTPKPTAPLHYECPACGCDITLAVLLYAATALKEPEE